ncbi:MAG: c-type cytochrome [Planctomycetota bacterium]
MKSYSLLTHFRWMLPTSLLLSLTCLLNPILGQTTTTEQFKLPEGFSAELVYEVPGEQGSWVSMTTDPEGRLIASDQYGSLYRVTLGETTNIETIDVQVGSAQGLLYAFDSLYVMSSGNNGRNGKPACKSGLYRVRDTNGDGQFDSAEHLQEIIGRGEHGPHAIVLSPDKKSLFVCGGNMTKLPKIGWSRQPEVWQEDQIIKRFLDPRGHAAGLRAPGGWICKVDPDGKNFEMVTSGFRNEYDFAIDPNGEFFTYDADMEWDFGLPWYRPTRVCHAVSGGEFGWRTGSGKWPEYYPDSLPPVIDIGPGSPTGVVFGVGAKFPGKYQNALYVSDWSYGIIYAIHLQPTGATYTATKEIFCTAPALPVTDIVVNGGPQGDGSMYFLIGGRRSQSALYRIRYTGEESTTAVAYPQLTAAAKERMRLEASHAKEGGEFPLGDLLTGLNSEHRSIRYAARIGLERKPIESWLPAISNAKPQARLEMITALARVGGEKFQDLASGALDDLNYDALTNAQQQHVIRNFGLILCRMGEPKPATKDAILKFESRFPTQDRFLNYEIGKLLVAGKSKIVTSKLVEMLRTPGSQESKIGYALTLSSATEGWTQPLRESYFQWFLDFANARGGNSFDGYLNNIRKHAVSQLSEADATAMKTLLAKKPTPKDPYAELKARPFVKKWSLEELMPENDDVFANRDLANGKKLFAVATCYKCHRVKGDGGVVGPDLTAAGRRFNTRDLLETIIDPSKAISDQYEAHMFQMADGRVINGRVVNISGGQYVVQPDMAEPNRLERIKVADIEATQPSKISPMPAGLLDYLTREEVLDLLAYMKSTVTDAEE